MKQLKFIFLFLSTIYAPAAFSAAAGAGTVLGEHDSERSSFVKQLKDITAVRAFSKKSYVDYITHPTLARDFLRIDSAEDVGKIVEMLTFMAATDEEWKKFDEYIEEFKNKTGDFKTILPEFLRECLLFHFNLSRNLKFCPAGKSTKFTHFNSVFEMDSGIMQTIYEMILPYCSEAVQRDFNDYSFEVVGEIVEDKGALLGLKVRTEDLGVKRIVDSSDTKIQITTSRGLRATLSGTCFPSSYTGQENTSVKFDNNWELRLIMDSGFSVILDRLTKEELQRIAEESTKMIDSIQAFREKKAKRKKKGEEAAAAATGGTSVDASASWSEAAILAYLGEDAMEQGGKGKGKRKGGATPAAGGADAGAGAMDVKVEVLRRASAVAGPGAADRKSGKGKGKSRATLAAGGAGAGAGAMDVEVQVLGASASGDSGVGAGAGVDIAKAEAALKAAKDRAYHNAVTLRLAAAMAADSGGAMPERTYSARTGLNATQIETLSILLRIPREGTSTIPSINTIKWNDLVSMLAGLGFTRQGKTGIFIDGFNHRLVLHVLHYDDDRLNYDLLDIVLDQLAHYGYTKDVLAAYCP